MQMLDFNAIEQPTWEVKLRNLDQVLHLSAPNEALIERLGAMEKDIANAQKKKDGRIARGLYTVLAEVMSHNEDFLTITAEDLRDKHRFTLADAFKFYFGYMAFMKEIEEAKN